MSQPVWWNRVVDEVSAFQVANPQNLPGAVFAAETQSDGKMVASVGDAWTQDTICAIGSMTKPFTATAVLLALEERDLLDVEAPVWQLPGMDVYADDPLKRQIKIRHLLQHTSGLHGGLQHYSSSPKAPCNDPTGESPCCCADSNLNLGPTVPWIGSPGYTNECMFADGRCQPARQLSLDQVSRYIMQNYSPSHQPGAEYLYSTFNYIVAARIVEELTGTSFNHYLKQKLFIPLGMSDSFFIAQPTGDPLVDAKLEEGVTVEQRARIADVTLITRDGKMPPEVAPGPDGSWDKLRRGWRFVYPDGGMYTTVTDLLTYLRMLRDGGLSEHGKRILTPAVIKLLVNDHGFGHTMGFGFRSRTTPYGQGSGTLEYMGNAMTYFWYDPVPGNPLLGVFLSQRIINAVVNNNWVDGMKVIFRVFVPQVKSATYELQTPIHA
jgi:CubicO group peptidase (beta-lactamase class C family)